LFSKYRVGITCSDPMILQGFAILLQEPECKITEENGEYFWSSTLFEGLQNGIEVSRKANHYLPALNGLLKLYLPDAPLFTRTKKILYDNGQGGTGMYWEESIKLPIIYSISEEQKEIRKQIWIRLVKSWAHLEGDLGNTLTNALAHYGEEVSWNSLYNTYEVIQKDYNKLQGRTNKRSYIPLPEEWTNIDGRNREKDFTESANNAYISGVSFARHSLETSEKVEKVEGTPYVEVMKGNGKKEQIHPMTLWEAKNFITRILNYWIESKYPTRANEQKQQSKTG
jgi:hypothetical protein